MSAGELIKYSAILAIIATVISAATSSLVALMIAKRSSSNTIFTVRATVRTAYRTRWLEEFRECVTNFIFLGQQVYMPLESGTPATLEERRELRKRAAHLLVLLGRDTTRADARPKLATAVRAYALEPSLAKEDEIELLVQNVFRERWDQITHETGQL